MSVRLAVWSGPRNISTALMRAWENRADCAVWDEPFYAYYLAATGIDHPGRDAVIDAGQTDWREVAAACCGAAPGGAALFYQKHMSHHLLAEIDYGWLDDLGHCFLLRDPAAVLRSYVKSRGDVSLDDIGVVQQLALYDYLAARQTPAPLVIDSADFLQQPQTYLQAMCAHIGVAFDEAMLNWPPGRRDSDGVWGEYWYDAVWRSTGFIAPAAATQTPLPARLADIARRAEPYYRTLYQRRLRLD